MYEYIKYCGYSSKKQTHYEAYEYLLNGLIKYMDVYGLCKDVYELQNILLDWIADDSKEHMIFAHLFNDVKQVKIQDNMKMGLSNGITFVAISGTKGNFVYTWVFQKLRDHFGFL